MYEVADKAPAWHTAYYYLGEYLRALSGGMVNHKILFDFVGDQGNYFNHGNPIVRKRTAGALSRLVHSEKYAVAMQRRYDLDANVFEEASHRLFCVICEEEAISSEELLACLTDRCLRDVITGLRNERDNHGRPLDLYRIECEAKDLVAWVYDQEIDVHADYDSLVRIMLESILRFMAFGHLETAFAESLIRETPLFGELPLCIALTHAAGACLARYEGGSSSLTGRRWMLDPCETFSIGRYTTCDSIERSHAISRVHCLIYLELGIWYLKDCETKHGTSVVRGNEGMVYNSLSDGSGEAFPLQFEDCIELACGSTRYLLTELP